MTNDQIDFRRKLLNSIIKETVRDETDEDLKESVRRKTDSLYALFNMPNIDDDELKKKIKKVIEED